MTAVKSILFVAMMSVILVTMNACNTVHGAGKDMERGGEHIQDAADSHK